MPRFDGTGPSGEGPMTGGARGYCAVRMPNDPNSPPTGYAGIAGRPLSRLSALGQRLGLGLRWMRGRGGRGGGRGRR